LAGVIDRIDKKIVYKNTASRTKSWLAQAKALHKRRSWSRHGRELLKGAVAPCF
jgi:hypothetical protein